MRVPRPKTRLTLLALFVVVACGDSPTAPASADAAFAKAPQSQENTELAQNYDLEGMSDRELLVAVLGKLNTLEERMDTETQAVYARVDSLLAKAGGYALLAAGEGGGQEGDEGTEGEGEDAKNGKSSSQQPWGVPQQLEELRNQMAQLQTSVGTLETQLIEVHDTLLIFKSNEEAAEVCVEIKAGVGVEVEGFISVLADGLGKLGGEAGGNGAVLRFLGKVGKRIKYKGFEAGGELKREWCFPTLLDGSSAQVAANNSSTKDHVFTAASTLGIDGGDLDAFLMQLPSLKDADPRGSMSVLTGVLPIPTRATTGLTDATALGNPFAFFQDAKGYICPAKSTPSFPELQKLVQKGCDFIATGKATDLDFNGGVFKGFF